MDLKKLPTPDDVQATLDQYLDRYGVRNYVEYVKYLKKDEEPPANATHIVSVRSLSNGAKVEAAVRVKSFYSMIVNFVLEWF